MRPILILAAFVAMTGLPGALGAQSLPYAGDGPLMLDPADLEWRRVASMPPPAEIAVIEGDLSKAEPFTMRLRVPDGYRIEPHIHPAYERVTVLSGALHFAHGERFDPAGLRRLGPGGMAIMPPGAPMYAQAEGDTVVQLHGTGPWGVEYLDPDDDPRR